MFCKYCHYEFYVPGDSLGAKIHCPNCTATLHVEDKQLLYPCPKCQGMLNVSLWMIGSESVCPHCNQEIILSIGEDSCKFFPEEAGKNSEMMKIASRKNGDIIGKYRVIRCLGIGGMGEVYLVEHTLLNTKCALKLLKSDIARQDPEMRARLLREARLASQIQHPNLIAVLDAELDESSDSCYIVMEYVDGVSIENILAGGPMLEERALQITAKVAEALKEAAEHKIIHRDIKPANIMLSSTGEVKLADLGIAKVESDNMHNMTLTMDNAVLGTPNYASPEQLRSSHKVDSRADIYSLGATLYHMLTGNRPFESESVFGVMANVLEKDMPTVHSVNPDVSVKTSDLIARMMAKKRDERPENFDVLIRELENGSPRKCFRMPAIKWKNIFSLKNIWQAFLGIVAVAGLIVASKLLYSKYRSAETDPGAVAVMKVENMESDVENNVQQMNFLIRVFRQRANNYPLDYWRSGVAFLKREPQEEMAKLKHDLLNAMESAFTRQMTAVENSGRRYMARILLEIVDGIESSVFDRYREKFNADKASSVSNDSTDSSSDASNDSGKSTDSSSAASNDSGKSTDGPVSAGTVPVSAGSDSRSSNETPAGVNGAALLRLAEAMRNFDVVKVKNIAAESGYTEVQSEFLVEFVRAAVRLDYARCRNQRDGYVGEPVIKEALNNRCESVKRTAGRFSYFTLSRELRQPLINYIENNNLHQDNPRIRHILSQMKNDVGSAQRNRSGVIIMSQPPVARALILKKDLPADMNNSVNLILNRIRSCFQYGGHSSYSPELMMASLAIILDSGYQIAPSRLEAIKKMPQLSEFISGEKFKPYDYSDFDASISVSASVKEVEKATVSPIAQPEEKKSEPAAADKKELEQQFDFGQLTAEQRANFIPSLLSDGVLKMDGIYHYSREFREVHGPNSATNKMPLDKSFGNSDFTVSIIFNPKENGKRIMPILFVRQMRWFKLMISNGKLSFGLLDQYIHTGFDVKYNAWHQCHISVSYASKKIIIRFDDFIKIADITCDLSRISTFDGKDFTFYNYGSGSAFNGYVKLVQFRNNSLSVAEIADLCKQFENRISGARQQMSQADNMQADYFRSHINAIREKLAARQDSEANDMVRRISGELRKRIKNLIASSDYNECARLLRLCTPARRQSSMDEWNIIGNMFKHEYCNAMEKSDNRKIEKIYHAWHLADHKNADPVHIVYSAFEYEYQRANYAAAKNILLRNRNAPEKIQNIMNEKLNSGKEIIKNELNDRFHYACNGNQYWRAKAIVAAMRDADVEDSIISTVRKRLRRVNGEKYAKKHNIKPHFQSAVMRGDFVILRVGLNNGLSLDDKEFSSSGKTLWQCLLENVESNFYNQSQYNRQKRVLSIICLLAANDKRAFNRKERQNIAKIPELADFVLTRK